MWELSAFTEPVPPAHLVRAVAFLVAGSVAGWVLYRLLSTRVTKSNTITTWGAERIFLQTLHDVSVVWFTILGALAAVQSLPFKERIASVIVRALAACVVLSGGWVASRAASQTIKLMSLRSGTATRGSSIFVNVARIVIVLIALLILLQTFGVRVGPLLAALGIGGLAIALALQEPLANFFAGLQLLATRKVRPGHYVKLDSGEEGYIQDIDWRHTSIRQLPDNMVLVPNAKLADAIITNFHYPDRETALLVEASVDRHCDLDEVERVTTGVGADVMRDVPGGCPDFEPFVRYQDLSNGRVDFTVILRVREVTDSHLVKHEFLKRLRRAYDREGIAIPAPVFDLDRAG